MYRVQVKFQNCTKFMHVNMNDSLESVKLKACDVFQLLDPASFRIGVLEDQKFEEFRNVNQITHSKKNIEIVMDECTDFSRQEGDSDLYHSLRELEGALASENVTENKLLSFLFKQWCRKEEFLTINPRRERFYSRFKSWKVSWTCSRPACKFKITFMRMRKNDYFQLDWDSSRFNHSDVILCRQMVKKKGRSSPRDIDSKMRNFIEGNSPLLKRRKDLAKAMNNTFYGVLFFPKQAYYLIEKYKRLKYGPVTSDAQSFIQKLYSQENDIYFRFRAEESTKRLSHFICASKDMLTKMKCYSDVLIFDITHQISRYNLNMALLVAVNNEYRSIIVCYGYLLNNNTESVTWFFERVREMFEFFVIPLPKVILSDDGNTVAPNIKKVFPQPTTQLLCAWHVSQNFKQKIRTKHLRSQARRLPFVDNLTEVGQILFRLMISGQLTEKEFDYVLTKNQNISAWCLAFQTNKPSLMISTTSRVEGMNSKLKRIADPNARLQELQEIMMRINDHTLQPKRHQGSSANVRMTGGGCSRLRMQFFRTQYSNFAFKLLDIEYIFAIATLQIAETLQEATEWKVTRAKGIRKSSRGIMAVSVKLKNGGLVCECLSYLKQLQLPCRHSLCVWATHYNGSIASAEILKIPDRWKENCEKLNVVELLPTHQEGCAFKMVLNPGEASHPGRKRKYNRFRSRLRGILSFDLKQFYLNSIHTE
jgi:hypothetical protein